MSKINTTVLYDATIETVLAHGKAMVQHPNIKAISALKDVEIAGYAVQDQDGPCAYISIQTRTHQGRPQFVAVTMSLRNGFPPNTLPRRMALKGFGELIQSWARRIAETEVVTEAVTESSVTEVTAQEQTMNTENTNTQDTEVVTESPTAEQIQQGLNEEGRAIDRLMVMYRNAPATYRMALDRVMSRYLKIESPREFTAEEVHTTGALLELSNVWLKIVTRHNDMPEDKRVPPSELIRISGPAYKVPAEKAESITFAEAAVEHPTAYFVSWTAGAVVGGALGCAAVIWLLKKVIEE